MQVNSLLKTLGCLVSASEKLSPPSTRVQMSLMTSRMTLLVVCSARRLKAADHRQAGVNHGGELAGEHDEVLQRDLAAGGPALFADFFLDGDDQEVPVKQRGNGRLFRACLDGVADFPARGGFAGNVSK